MIKNFKNKLVGKTVEVPVWKSQQRYDILTIFESNDAKSWCGDVSMKKQESPFHAPEFINIVIRKYPDDLDYVLDVKYNTNGNNPRMLQAKVTPNHLKSPDTFSNLIAKIINNPDTDYHN